MELTEETVRRILDIVDQGITRDLGQPIPGQMCVQAAVCYALGEPHSEDPSCVWPSLQAFGVKLNDTCEWSNDESRAKGMRRFAIAQMGTEGGFDERAFSERVVAVLMSKLLPNLVRTVAVVLQNELNNRLPKVARQCRTTGICGTESASSEEASPFTNVSACMRESATVEMVSSLQQAATAVADAVEALANSSLTAAENVAHILDLASCAVGDAATATALATKLARDPTTPEGAADAWKAMADAGNRFLCEFAEHVVQVLVEMKTPGCNFLYLTDEPTNS